MAVDFHEEARAGLKLLKKELDVIKMLFNFKLAVTYSNIDRVEDPLLMSATPLGGERKTFSELKKDVAARIEASANAYYDAKTVGLGLKKRTPAEAGVGTLTTQSSSFTKMQYTLINFLATNEDFVRKEGSDAGSEPAYMCAVKPALTTFPNFTRGDAVVRSVIEYFTNYKEFIQVVVLVSSEAVALAQALGPRSEGMVYIGEALRQLTTPLQAFLDSGMGDQVKKIAVHVECVLMHMSCCMRSCAYAICTYAFVPTHAHRRPGEKQRMGGRCWASIHCQGTLCVGRGRQVLAAARDGSNTCRSRSTLRRHLTNHSVPNRRRPWLAVMGGSFRGGGFRGGGVRGGGFRGVGVGVLKWAPPKRVIHPLTSRRGA